MGIRYIAETEAERDAALTEPARLRVLGARWGAHLQSSGLSSCTAFIAAPEA